ncbi:translation initiation factor IF-2 [Saccharomonospora azurea SZMC 14600]|nr:translation initiation factor IF-2 [Saccharomonospora azurea SZMC 14600]
MAGKARVHELAKELGVTSKEVLAKLKEQGEFVKSASSTVEAPVARRLRDAFSSKDGKQAEKSSGKDRGPAPNNAPSAPSGRGVPAPKPAPPQRQQSAQPAQPAQPQSAPAQQGQPKPALAVQ